MISLIKIALWSVQGNAIQFREQCPFCQRKATVKLSRNQFKEVAQNACTQHFSGYEWKPERGVIEFRFQNSTK